MFIPESYRKFNFKSLQFSWDSTIIYWKGDLPPHTADRKYYLLLGSEENDISIDNIWILKYHISNRFTYLHD